MSEPKRSCDPCPECGSYYIENHGIDCSKTLIEERARRYKSHCERLIVDLQRNAATRRRINDQVTFWQGKFNAVRRENNKLRSQVKEIRMSALAKIVRNAVEEEREACARIPEDLVTHDPEHEKYIPEDAAIPCGWCDGLEKAAEKIRSRGEKREDESLNSTPYVAFDKFEDLPEALQQAIKTQGSK